MTRKSKERELERGRNYDILGTGISSIVPLPNNTGIQYTISHTACSVYRKYHSTHLQLQFAELGFIDLIIFLFSPFNSSSITSPLLEARKKKETSILIRYGQRRSSPSRRMIIQNFRNFTHSRLAYGLSGHHVTVQQLDQLAVILKTALNNPTSASSQTRPSLRLLAFPFRPPAFTALATLSQSPIFITFSYPSFVAPRKELPALYHGYSLRPPHR